jgi:phage repressor protein C with HTH and peptisase S24 domain
VKFTRKNVLEEESPVYQRLNFLVDNLENGNQADFARRIGVRSGVVGDMFGKRRNKPSFDVLAKIVAAYPQLRVEWLLSGEGEMLKSATPPNTSSLHSSTDLYIQPDTKGNVQAPLINYKAAANYLAGYQSNEYYEELEAITLPKHMAKGAQPVKGFYLTGDSMEPTFYADDIAVCQQVPRGEWRLLKEETVAVVVSNSRGLQLKRVTVRPSLGTLRCQSDNPHSPAFDLSIDEDVLELWRFEWLLTKRCERANQDLPEWRRQIENEVGDLRYLLEQVLDKKELLRLERPS